MATDPHVMDWLPAYALGSLDKEDKAQVETHLRQCSLCQRELQAYQNVVDQLPLTTPLYTPPPRVRQAILERAAQSAAHVPAPHPQTSLFSRLRGLLTSPIPAWSLIGALVVLVALLAMTLVQGQRLAAAPAPDFHVIQLAGTNNAPQASAWVVVSDDGRAGTLITEWLPPLPAGKEYQLWLTKDGKRTNGGVFWVDEKGYASMWVNTKDPLISFKQFGVTVEPKGGSPAPTGSKVLGGGA
ncbi:MAG TPA: anti-sigma factor [Anaerolineaceae bacterium]|jgi:anti-sigma-K factor RskA